MPSGVRLSSRLFCKGDWMLCSVLFFTDVFLEGGPWFMLLDLVSVVRLSSKKKKKKWGLVS